MLLILVILEGGGGQVLQIQVLRQGVGQAFVHGLRHQDLTIIDKTEIGMNDCFRTQPAS